MERRTDKHSLGQNELLRKIQELAFMKVECELYLDAYPECKMALDQYKDIVKQYAALTERYENEFGQIRQENTHGDEWKWVKSPWPWQADDSGKER